MRQQPLSEAEFRQIYSKVPRLCVDIILKHTSHQGIVLVLRKHQSWNNLWHFPGGTVFYQEPLRQTVLRIIQEEIGVPATIDHSLPPIEFFSEIEHRGFGYSVAIPYVCVTQHQLPSQNQAGELIQLFSTVPENMIQEQKAVLKQVLDNY